MLLKKAIFYRSLALCFVILAVLRAWSSFDKISVSIDELQHVATGIEWLENHTYELEALHPPLARIVAALPLYLFHDIRFGTDFYDEYCSASNETSKDYIKEFHGRIKGGELVFHQQDRNKYDLYLSLARSSSLFFFIIGAIALYLWTKCIWNEAVACSAVFFYSALPIILASCVIINTDMAGTAMMLWSLYISTQWLETPNTRNTILLGIFIACMCLSKFSVVIFFAGTIALTVMYLECKYSLKFKALSLSNWKIRLLLLLTILLLIWAGYNFSIEVSAFYILPFPEFFRGLSELIARNNIAFQGYCLGKLLFFKGVWYFFPIATLFKTPLSFLILVVIGTYYIIKRAQRNAAILLIGIISIYLIGLLSNISIGLRHLLPAFALMSIIAGYGINILLLKNILHKSIAIVLSISFIISSAYAHKDYIAYFNILAGDSPEDILIEGDFDIGQDTRALADFLKQHDMIDKTIFYAYNAPMIKYYGFKHYEILFGQNIKEFNVIFGDFKYLAITKTIQKVLPLQNWEALTTLPPLTSVGETILIYERIAAIEPILNTAGGSTEQSIIVDGKAPL